MDSDHIGVIYNNRTSIFGQKKSQTDPAGYLGYLAGFLIVLFKTTLSRFKMYFLFV